MIATVDVCIEAANPSMPLFPMRAFVDSPSSARIRNVPKKIGNWQINSVQFTVKYPDESIKTAECKLVGGVWVGTVEGCSTAGFSQNGYTIFASGIDENGNAVNDYILGKGDVTIIDAGGIVTPTTTTTYVHLLSAMPAAPKDGDVWPSGNTYFIYQNNAAHQLGGLLSSDLDDTLTQHNKAAEAYATGTAIEQVGYYANTAIDEVGQINLKIPEQASEENQLADKAFVNSSVQTATANFRGNWATWNDVPTNVNDYPVDYAGSKTPTVNDYLVVQDVVVEGKEGTWRYKYSGTWDTDGKNGWLPEYQVNETPFTAAQLAAINSGITTTKVSYIKPTDSALNPASENPVQNKVILSALNDKADVQALANYTTPADVSSIVSEKTWIVDTSGLPTEYTWQTSVGESFANNQWYYDISLYCVELSAYAASTDPVVSNVRLQSFTQAGFTIWDDVEGYPIIYDASLTATKNGSSVFGFAYEDELSGYVKNDGGVSKIKSLTQAEYDAISATVDLSTLYVIPEEA